MRVGGGLVGDEDGGGLVVVGGLVGWWGWWGLVGLRLSSPANSVDVPGNFPLIASPCTNFGPPTLAIPSASV